MKSHKVLSFYIILLLTNITLSGQNIKNELPVQHERTDNKHLKNKDAVIISEYNMIDIIGKKMNFIYFSVTKKIEFKILSSSGIERFSKFCLPETFDPTYVAHFPAGRNYTNVYSEIKSNYFKVSIVTKDNEKKNAVIKQTIENVTMVSVENDQYGNYERPVYKIENMNIGDNVTVEYNYNVPYSENFKVLTSFRIFFNNDIFKESYQLTIKKSSDLDINIQYYNNGQPDSITQPGNNTIYYWNKSALYGCINEDGSRPYMSLPYLIFSIKPPELVYTLPFSFEEKYLPFYTLFSYPREKNHTLIVESVYRGYNSKQFNEIKEFVTTETQNISNDTLAYYKLMTLHNKISDEFTFTDDTDYFNRTDENDPKMGDDLSRKTIRDICRYDLYVALIAELDLNYFTAYLADIRSGVVNNEYFIPMYHSDYIFAVLLNNKSPQYLYPKKSRFGYYLNELPFYFENTRARLVHLNDYREPKYPINDKLRQVLLPNSNIIDNVRKSYVMVKVNTDSLITEFKARISLSGQFSTLTRGLYLFNCRDETINSLYNKKIWELNDNIQVKHVESKINSKEFPFPAVINAEYQAKNILKKNGDTITLNLKNWFNHIIYNNFDTSKRQLDFYPDFCGTNSYTYSIEFEKNIKIISNIEDYTIKNEFGELTFSIEQVKPNTVILSSSFSTISNMIQTDKINTVKEIYDKIQYLNNDDLQFKLE